jgi:uncharacterized membrane protein
MERKYLFGIDDGGRTAGMISYFFVIGWSLGYFGFHQPNKNTLSAFHLRQTLFLYLSFLAFWFGIAIFHNYLPATGLLSADALKLALVLGYLGMWIAGLNSATNAEEKPVPVVGNIAQNLFSFIKEGN